MTTEPASTSQRSVAMRRLGPAAALVGLPVVLLLLNDSWAFTPVDSGVDPWFYTGLFTHYPDHLREFAGTYYVTRLPHIAAGAAAHSIFDPTWASYALRLFYWYLSAFAVYGTVCSVTGSRVTAFVTAVLLGTSVYFLWAIGWDYVDGAGAAWLMASACLFALRPRRAERAVWLLAGMCQLFAAATYILVVVLLPLQLLFAVLLRIRRRTQPVTVGWIGWIAAGWCFGGGLLALLNWVATGRFNFIAPQLQAAVTLSADRAEWIRPTYGWVLGANWLFLTAAACICALVFIGMAARHRRTGDGFWRGAGMAESIPLLAAVAGFAFMETRGFWALQLSYVAVYLLPFSMLVIAAALSVGFARLGEHKVTLVGALVFGAALVPFLPAVARLYPRCTPFCATTLDFRWLLIGGTAALLIGTLSTRRAVLATAAALMITAANPVFADLRIFIFAPNHGRPTEYTEVVSASRLIALRSPGDTVRFWYDYKEPLGPVYRAIAATYIWSYSLVGEDFPALAGALAFEANPLYAVPADKRPQRVSDGNVALAPGEAIVVLTQRTASEVLDEVVRWGLVPHLLGDDQRSYAGKPYRIVSIRLEPTGQLVPIPLETVRPEHGTVSSTNAPSPLATVTTPPVAWGYGAGVDLRHAMTRLQRQTFVALAIAEAHGRVGLCVLNSAETDCVARKMIDEGEAGTVVYLAVKDPRQASRLIIQSWDLPESGRVSVSNVGILHSNGASLGVPEPGSRNSGK